MKEISKEKSVAKSAARDLSYTALFVAIISVCAWISVPVGEIPVTLQTMAICMAGGFLGWKRGFFATLAYLLLGFCGAPVFAGFTGGVAKLTMPTGGYLIGFLFAAPIVGAFSDYIKPKNPWLRGLVLAAAMILGSAVYYVFGTAWFVMLYARANKAITVGAAVSLCVAPYILPDLVKIVFASVLVTKLKKYIKY